MFVADTFGVPSPPLPVSMSNKPPMRTFLLLDNDDDGNRREDDEWVVVNLAEDVHDNAIERILSSFVSVNFFYEGFVTYPLAREKKNSWRHNRHHTRVNNSPSSSRAFAVEVFFFFGLLRWLTITTRKHTHISHTKHVILNVWIEAERQSAARDHRERTTS